MANLPLSLSWISQELVALEEAGLKRFRRVRPTRQGPIVVLDGVEVINFGSNDYRGLSQHPAVIRAACQAARRFGWGSAASPVVCGYSRWHHQLEEALAQFHRAEAAVVFGSGYAANVGVVTSLVGPGDIVFMDRANHASLWDGCRLSQAAIRLFDHRELTTLRRQLEKRRHYRRALIVTDSVFSIDGDVAPLEELVALAQHYEAMLLADEAHAIGVFGPRGEGLVAELGLEEFIPVRVGTLSKALGSIGGYVVGPRAVIDWLISKARSYIFSTALPPAAVAAATRALQLLSKAPHEGLLLRQRAARLRQQLEELGWCVGPSQSQILSLVVGEPEKALQLSAGLFTRGLYCPAMRPPTVPQERSCIRLSLGVLHTEEMITKLVRALSDLRQDF